jgi:hypothetical protein
LVTPQEIVKTLRQADAQIFAGWRHYDSLYDQIPQIQKLATMIVKILEEEGIMTYSILKPTRICRCIFWVRHKWKIGLFLCKNFKSNLDRKGETACVSILNCWR